MLWAHVITSLAAIAMSVAVVVVAALLFGFRSGAGVLAWLAVAGILALFTLALTWLAVIPGLTAKSVDGASAFSYPLILLPFISSAFVPTATMPGPVRAFAENQPVTAIVDAIRNLLARAAGRHRHLGRPRLVPRAAGRRLRVRDARLPPQAGLRPRRAGTAGCGGRRCRCAQDQVGCSTVPCCTQVAVHAPGVTCTFIRRRQCTHQRGGSSSARRAHRAWSPSATASPH